MILKDWFVSCYKRLKVSNHKRYLVLFVILSVIFVRLGVEATEWVVGVETPQWGWRVIILAYVTAGICWLNLMREVPHVEPSERRVEWTRPSR